MSSLLEISGLTAGYRPDLPILHGISLHVDRGECVTIVGPNGAGKSTLLKAIAGIVPVSSGAVTLDGRNITGLATHCMAQASVAYVPQSANVFTTLTIAENLTLGALTLPRVTARRQMEAAYSRFPDLYRFRTRKARILSGGQRQMLAVARALLIDPAVLMLDEPSAGLSPKLVEEVFTHLERLSASGVTILMVEQNVRAGMALSHRTYVLADGRNRLEGASSALTVDPRMQAIFLGREERMADASSSG